MTYIKLGFRSLFRQRRRTAMTLLVISFGIGALILTMGHTAYIDWGLRESTIHSETGHIQLFNDHFFDEEEETILALGLDNAAELEAELNQNLEVQLVQSRIELMGLISNGEKSVAFVGEAVEAEKEIRLRNLFGNTAQAFDSLICDHPDEVVVLGRALARSLDVAPGDWVTVMTSTTDGALNAVDLRVADTFSATSVEYEKRALKMNLETAQSLLMSDRVQYMMITLEKTSMTDPVYERLSAWASEKKLPLIFKKWHERASYYHQVRKFFQQITGFMSAILFVIVFFASSNTVVMAIVERTREIGTLLSVGTGKIQAMLIFLYEGLFLGAIGGVCAMAFAQLLTWVVNSANIMMPAPPGSSSGYALLVRAEWQSYAAVFGATVLAVAVSSLMPALRVTRMNIVDALGHI